MHEILIMNSKAFKTVLEKGNIDGLIELLKNEIKEDSTNITPRLQLGKAYLKINEYPNALNTYILLLEIDPENEEALYQQESTSNLIKQSQLDVYACTNTHMDPWA